jgi:hypothetical protein
VTRDRETLQAVGEALYGPLWQSDLARELGVAIRTVQRWGAGHFEIPDRIWPEVAAICAKRGAALQAWAKRLG